MRSTTPALRGPRATLVALVLVALAPSSAQALVSLTADGTCSASAQYHISAGQERAINTPCTVNRGNAPDEVTASGLAVASGLTDITGMSMFSASASFGALLIDSDVFARVNPDWLRYLPGSYARGTGSTTASASFQDTLTLDPAHVGPTNTVDVAVSGMIEVGTQTSAHTSGSVSFAIRLNGTSIYTIDTSTDRNDGHNPFSFSFTASATDVIDVVAWANANTEVNTVGVFPLTGGADGGDNLTSLAVNINTIGSAARLIAESGHNYASAISPIPEPATWALMAVGLLVLGASSAQRRKAAALNAD